MVNAGAAGGFIDYLGYAFCRGRIVKDIEVDYGQFDNPIDLFWASGAAFFTQAKVFKQLGGFDETFFAHYEEIDLCWRMKNVGYRICYNPKSTIYHLGGGTMHSSSPQKTYLNFRNSLFTLYKNYRGNYLFFMIMWRMILDYLAAAVFILNGEFKAAWQVVRAQFHFLGKLSDMKKKRRALNKSTQGIVPNKKGIYSKSVVFSRFIRFKKHFSELDPKAFVQ